MTYKIYSYTPTAIIYFIYMFTAVNFYIFLYFPIELKYFKDWGLKLNNCSCKILLFIFLCVQPADGYLISQNM